MRSKSEKRPVCCEAPPGGRASAVAEACSEESCAVPTAESDSESCPISGTIGSKVDLITVKALVNGGGLSRLEGEAYRFCPAPDCDGVYFDNRAGSVFRKSDLTVRVGLKEKDDPIPICYCFGFTAADLRRDLAAQGETEIPAIIAAEVRAGHCACEVKNPQGSCCLGSVSKAVRRIQSESRAISQR